MNISEEKTYLYEMMRNVTEERRELTKIYYELKSRLDDLIMLETRGLEETPIKGIVDLHNARDVQRVASNLRRETENTIGRIEREAEIKGTPLEKTVIPKVEIDIEKEKEAKKTRKNSGLTIDKAAGIIAHTLKEYGAPIKAKELYELVNAQLEVPITRSNFSNNVLPRSSKVNKRINNVSRGFWQYL